jgi:hypothetical protein
MCVNMVFLRISGLLGVRRSSSSSIVTLPITPQLRDLVRHSFNRLWCKPLQHLECDGAKSGHGKRPVILLHCLFGDANLGCRDLTKPRGGAIILGLAGLAA